MSSSENIAANMGVKAPRNQFLDLVKGWLIFLVVWGHAIQFLGYQSISFDATDGYYKNPVYIGIYSFHMALFMGISGYLAYGAIRKRSFFAFSKVRAIQILVPLFAWSAARHLAGPVKRILSERDLSVLVQEIAEFPFLKLGEEVWFLWAVFIAGVLVSAAQMLGRWRMLGFVGGFVLLILLPQGEVIKLSAFTYPFFVGGFLLAERGVSRMPPLAWLVVALVVWCGAVLVWNPQTYVYVSGMEWKGNLLNLAARFSGGVAGSMLFLAGIWWLSKRWMPQMVVRWGRETLAIYIIQTYLFFPLMGMFHPLRDWTWFSVTAAPVFAVMVCCLCVGVARLVGKNRYLAALLFGVPLKPKSG